MTKVFKTSKKKIKEKLRLFEHSEVLIYQKNSLVDSLIGSNIKTFSWSLDDKQASVYITQKSIVGKTQLTITYNNISF